MRKCLTLASILWAASSLAGPALAAPPSPETVSLDATDTAPSPAAAVATAEARALGRQMATELAEILEANRAAVATLEARLAEAPLDQHEAIQAEITAAKAGVTLQYMELQLRFARLAGNEPLATEIEQKLERQRNPAPVATPAEIRVDRPVPGTEGQ